ncbi:MAG: 50S ribosome-binding GTPase [Planctomycetes bacterium]|nr:50S ribosome-binding GTPase [Planctomycetota bacterium]
MIESVKPMIYPADRQSLDLYLLTTQARAGISVLLLRGNGADRLLKSRFQTSKGGKGKLPVIGRAAHGYLLERDQMLDEILLVHVEEDPPGFEICCHGGSGAGNAIVKALTQAGATAHPWSDLVKKDTLSYDVFTALFQSQGRIQGALLAHQDFGGLRQSFLRLLAILKDQASFHRPTAAQDQEILSMVKELEESYQVGRFLYQIPKVVLAGSPNAGKSTLFNAMLCDQRALTSKIPGTTLDPVEAILVLDGFPLRIFDLPGIRKSPISTTEARANQQAEKLVDEADLIVRVVALPFAKGLDEPLVTQDESSYSSESTLIAMNKVDQLNTNQVKELNNSLKRMGAHGLLISALNGEGVQPLLDQMDQKLGFRELRGNFRSFLFNEQQRSLVRSTENVITGNKNTSGLIEQIESYLAQ